LKGKLSNLTTTLRSKGEKQFELAIAISPPKYIFEKACQNEVTYM